MACQLRRSWNGRRAETYLRNPATSSPGCHLMFHRPHHLCLRENSTAEFGFSLNSKNWNDPARLNPNCAEASVQSCGKEESLIDFGTEERIKSPLLFSLHCASTLALWARPTTP